jgi:hypothetical protein
MKQAHSLVLIREQAARRQCTKAYEQKLTARDEQHAQREHELVRRVTDLQVQLQKQSLGNTQSDAQSVAHLQTQLFAAQDALQQARSAFHAKQRAYEREIAQLVQRGAADGMRARSQLEQTSADVHTHTARAYQQKLGSLRDEFKQRELALQRRLKYVTRRAEKQLQHVQAQVADATHSTDKRYELEFERQLDALRAEFKQRERTLTQQVAHIKGDAVRKITRARQRLTDGLSHAEQRKEIEYSARLRELRREYKASERELRHTIKLLQQQRATQQLAAAQTEAEAALSADRSAEQHNFEEELRVLKRAFERKQADLRRKLRDVTQRAGRDVAAARADADDAGAMGDRQVALNVNIRLAEARKAALEREATLQDDVKRHKKQLAAAHAQVAELEAEVQRVQTELQRLPSVAEWRQSRALHFTLKKKLQETETINELRDYMGTSELIRRDRDNHRLGLGTLAEDVPAPVLVEVVQACMRILDIRDVKLVVPSLARVSKVIAALPPMQQFVRQVCQSVFTIAQSVGGGANTELLKVEAASPLMLLAAVMPCV